MSTVLTQSDVPASVLCGLGAALPSRVVSNDELSHSLDTSDDWIRTRTGIRQRHWAETGVATSDLAVEAGVRALKSAAVDAADLVVLATTTPDHPCPATAPEVATRLGLAGVPAFDLAAVCSGFVYALATASGAIAAGLARTVLVIGAETYSTILDPRDRAATVIFGDGAGAVVLRAGDRTETGALLAFDWGSDGEHRDYITIPGFGARQRSTGAEPETGDGYFTMRGKEVFVHAVRRMSDSAAKVLGKVGWSADEVDRFVAHQANLRIVHSAADRLGLDRAKAAVHLDRVGNTSAASIPLALSDCVATGAVATGDRVLLTAFGGGLTWGSVALRWPDLDLG